MKVLQFLLTAVLGIGVAAPWCCCGAGFSASAIVAASAAADAEEIGAADAPTRSCCGSTDSEPSRSQSPPEPSGQSPCQDCPCSLRQVADKHPTGLTLPQAEDLPSVSAQSGSSNLPALQTRIDRTVPRHVEAPPPSAVERLRCLQVWRV